MAGKKESVVYNEMSGDASFRSLLTPHSAWTFVRAVSYWGLLAAFYGVMSGRVEKCEGLEAAQISELEAQRQGKTPDS